jgi:amino acid adenylation domain-containing protein
MATFFFPPLLAWKGMLQQLYDTSWVFYQVMNRFSKELRSQLVDALYGELELSPLLAKAAGGAVQLSLACLWQSWGIRPSTCFGHGHGELVARIFEGELNTLELLGDDKKTTQQFAPPRSCSSDLHTKSFVICMGPIDAAIGLEPFLSCVAAKDRSSRSLARALGKWFVSGGDVDWESYYSGFRRACQHMRLPPYPFQRTHVEPLRGVLPPPEVNHEERVDPVDHGARPTLLASVSCILERQEEDLDLRASFLENGGDSLTLPRMQKILLKDFGVKVTQEDLINLPLNELLCGVKVKDCKSIVTSSAYRHDPFPLTPIQEACVWGRSVSNISAHGYLEVDVESTFDLGAFESSFHAMIQKHDMLRMELIPDDNANGPGYMQRIQEPMASGDFKCEVFDLTDLTPERLASRLQELRENYSHEVIAVTEGALFKIRASRCLDEGEVWWRLHFSFDSLAIDMFSMRILFCEWHAIYAGELEKPRLQLSFRDWVMWSEEQTLTPEYQKAKLYWEHRYAKMPGAPALRLQMNPDDLKSWTFRRCLDYIDQNTWQNLKFVAKQRGRTGSSVVLTLFAAVLGRWSETQDFLINLTTFERDPMLHSQIVEIIGDFTSVILLEVHTSSYGREPFKDSVRKVLQQLNSDLRHKQYDGVRVQQELHRLSKNSAVAPVVFTSLLNLPLADGHESVGQRFGKVAFSITQTPQVWLDCKVFEADSRLAVEWDYVADLLPSDHVQGMHEAFCRLLRVTGCNFDFTLPLPEVLGVSQLKSWCALNSTSREWRDCPSTLQGLLRKRLSQQCDSAVIWDNSSNTGSHSLSVQTLQRHIHSLAGRLRPEIGPSDIVAIHMARSPGLIVAIYSVVEVAGAYLPLDCDQPRPRKQYMLTNSGSKALIHSRDSLGFEGLCLESPEVDFFEFPEAVEFVASPLASPDDLAYVIYTSGSTGKPKGVAVQHKAIVNRLAWMQDTYQLRAEDVVMQKTSYSFDVSVWEFFWPLFGASLLVAQPDLQADAEYLRKQIAKHRVSIIHFVLGMLKDFLGQALAAEDLSSLRHVFCSGEALYPDVVKRAYEILTPQTQLHNLYGPTEAAVDVTFWPCPRVPQFTAIGLPIANMQVFILNSGQLCPPGVTGEIHLAGIGLAKGYLDNEDS